MTITLNISDILAEYFYTPYLDKTPLPLCIAKQLAIHEQHDKLYHVEFWTEKETNHEHATLWRVSFWKIYSEKHGCNLAKYWEEIHPAPKLVLSPREKIRREKEEKVKQLEQERDKALQAGEFKQVAMIELALALYKT